MIELVNLSAPDCIVEKYEFIIPTLVLPDEKDRHVVAAAIAGHADTIVTFNLKDFPEDVMDSFGINVQHPDDFLMNQLQLRQFDALEIIRKVRERYKSPPMTADEFVGLIQRNRLSQTAQYLRSHLGLI